MVSGAGVLVIVLVVLTHRKMSQQQNYANYDSKYGSDSEFGFDDDYVDRGSDSETEAEALYSDFINRSSEVRSRSERRIGELTM